LTLGGATPAILGWDGASRNEAPSLQLETTPPENKPHDDEVNIIVLLNLI
jgi:hypothetical protein